MKGYEVPKHVAIIMDGNGRWALREGKERIVGHERGAKVLCDIVEEALDLGIGYMTFFVFSTENWQRPADEVVFILQDLLPRYLDLKLDFLMDRGVRLKVIGEVLSLPVETVRALDRVVEETSGNRGIQVTFAVNYGGRQEILQAARGLARDAIQDPGLVDRVDEGLFRTYLYDPDVPDPDLVIRTSGERRLSNFLLWQLSYAEAWATETLWPDFSRAEFRAAIQEYGRRQRRFGSLGDSGAVPKGIAKKSAKDRKKSKSAGRGKRKERSRK